MSETIRLFQAFQAAERDLALARQLRAEIGALDDAAHRLGDELAERRVRRAERQVSLTRDAFTGGRPLGVAIWSLPDEL